MIRIIKKVNITLLKGFLEKNDISIKYSNEISIIDEDRLFFKAEVVIDNNIYIVEFPKFKKQDIIKRDNVIIPFYKDSAIEDLADITNLSLLKKELFQRENIFYFFTKEQNQIKITQLVGYKLDYLKYILAQLNQRELFNYSVCNNVLVLLKKEEYIYDIDEIGIPGFPVDLGLYKINQNIDFYNGLEFEEAITHFNKKMKNFKKYFQQGNSDLKRSRRKRKKKDK